MGLSRCRGEWGAEHPTHPYIWGITPVIPRVPKLEYLDLRFNSLPIPEEILEKIDEPQLIISAYFERVGLVA